MPNLDVSNDWTIMDWLQTIYYYSRTSETTWGGAIAMSALKRENKRHPQFGDMKVEITGNKVIWELWVTAMSTPIIPSRGDKFTASGISGNQTWMVEEVDYCDKTTRYRLNCMQLGEDQ